MKSSTRRTLPWVSWPSRAGEATGELQVARQESDQSGFGLQTGNIAVEVKPIQTLDGEGDVLVEDRFNRGQGLG